MTVGTDAEEPSTTVASIAVSLAVRPMLQRSAAVTGLTNTMHNGIDREKRRQKDDFILFSSQSSAQ
jgi:hypothetical protein